MFKFAFRFHAFHGTSEMLNTQKHNKFNLQHYFQIKTLQIVVTWSSCETEMPQKIVFQLNWENKMLKIRKFLKKPAKLKQRQNCMLKKFLALNYIRELLNMVVMRETQRFDIKRGNIR